jgi:large subunit ribosomal protein L3
MAKGHKPKAGSRGYWPKKRAKRIYPRVKARPQEGGARPLGFAGYKAGMTRVMFTCPRGHLQGQEITESVTILDCPALFVYGIRTYLKTPYGFNAQDTIISEKPQKDLARRTRLPKKPDTQGRLQKAEAGLEGLGDVRLLVHTQPRNSGLGKKKPEIFELPLSGNVKEKWQYARDILGKELKHEQVFKPGEFTDIRAVTKGKGFQGPVKRFGVKIRGRKSNKKRRHIGTLGPRNVARVLPGKIPQAGQLGFQTRTEYNKKILQLGSGGINPSGGWLNYGPVKGDFILIRGSVPGPRKRLIILEKPVRPTTMGREPIEIKEIFLNSQQGV